jgi:hypothetical protein
MLDGKLHVNSYIERSVSLFQVRFAVKKMLGVSADCVGPRLFKMNEKKSPSARCPTARGVIFA